MEMAKKMHLVSDSPSSSSLRITCSHKKGNSMTDEDSNTNFSIGTYGSNRSSLNALRSNKRVTELGMFSGDDRGFQVHYYCYPSANRQASTAAS